MVPQPVADIFLPPIAPRRRWWHHSWATRLDLNWTRSVFTNHVASRNHEIKHIIHWRRHSAYANWALVSDRISVSIDARYYCYGGRWSDVKCYSNAIGQTGFDTLLNIFIAIVFFGFGRKRFQAKMKKIWCSLIDEKYDRDWWMFNGVRFILYDWFF